jgi:putative drug exporter of the RND superfamily
MVRIGMDAVARFIAGRRTKYLVVVIWLLALVALAPLGGKLGDVTDSNTETFLPKSAESTEVLRTLNERFAKGQTQNGLIVYQHSGGFTAADKRKIAADAREAQRRLPLTAAPAVPLQPGSPQALVSRSGDVAFTSLDVPDNQDKVSDWGKRLKNIAGDQADGMNIYVTGSLGFSADADEVFSSIDTKLLLATVLLVLILLGAIYRSPLIALTPLVVVGVAYTAAQGLIYLYAKSGQTVSENATQILIVLMFGVGTDYCLLLVSRYREELRRQQDKHDAMAHALSRAGPAILASGLTVALAMLVLLVADVGSTHTLGPVAAIGVFTGMLAGLTLLPALLTIAGRRGFWPRRRLIAYDPADEGTTGRGLWRRFGDRVLQRPGPALAATVVLFAIGGLGLLAYKVDYSTTSFFKKSVESVQGFKVLETSFPAGVLQPTNVLVERSDGPARPADIAAAERRLRAVSGVAAVAPVRRSDDGKIAELNVILEGDPYKSSQLDVVPKMRDALSTLPAGVAGLVGGGSAVNYDFDKANKRDLSLVAPIALALIAVILGILLTSVVAPLVLIASVIVSFLGTIGLSMLFIRFVAGDAGIDSSLPTFAFIFLVALGIDYTIFLMSRVREEAREHGTREGMLRALSATGPVITSAGIILAGTFSVLMTLPVSFTFDLGFMVALGILLDTFVVRTIMVPAAVELIGDKIWWPSTAAGGARLFHDRDSATDPAAKPLTEPGGAG